MSSLRRGGLGVSQSSAGAGAAAVVNAAGESGVDLVAVLIASTEVYESHAPWPDRLVVVPEDRELLLQRPAWPLHALVSVFFWGISFCAPPAGLFILAIE